LKRETILNRLLVIGGPTFDVLHLEDRTVECAGGAGMYTAMAARRCGAQVALYAFVGPVLPPVGHPQALDYFFVATLQQFSFWTERHNRYDRPMIATIGGVERKGSDYLWEAFRRWFERDPGFCSPQR
jgi:hypothetical protein